MRKYTIERNISIFWSKVNKDGAIPAHSPELGNCWLWTAFCYPNGYGKRIWENGESYAHRVSWIINRGEIPDGLQVLHKCDVRNCVNPKHLFLGTQKDNMRDMINKGRMVIPPRNGEKNSNSKLTIAQVREIRIRYAVGGISHKKLGDEFGISDGQIGYIVNYKGWKEDT